jgi:hypothetical protein
MEAIKGKKTYIVLVIFVAAIIAEKFLGMDVPGFDPGADWMQQIMAALGLGALRAGVAGQ